MSIEFPCSQCGKLLRVGDDAAGKQARCPSCSAVQEIPPTAPSAQNPFGVPSAPPSAARVEENPYQSPSSAPWYPGHENAFGPVARGAFQPTPIDAGDVLNRTWIMFKQQFWMMALVGFLYHVCTAGFGFVVGQLVTFSVVAIRGGGPLTQADLITTQVIVQTLGFLFATWIEVGMVIYMLKAARGESVGLGDIFSSGRFWATAVAARFLLFLAVGFGLLLLIIPGVILALMFSQALFLIVDRGKGPLEALGTSKAITSGNKLQIFVLGLATVGVGFVGALACCVGVWPAMAFIALMWATAYLAMTGQPTADETLMRPPVASPFAPPPAGELR